jgi:quinol monooxygenase YgiN
VSRDSSVLYEVVLTVAPEVRDAFCDWLGDHIDHMLALDGFLSGDAFVDSENPNEIICHYRLRDMTAMTAYLEGMAMEMRKDGLERFGDKFSARRRILTRL